MEKMEKKETPCTSNCSFTGIRPAMADLPYPPMQVKQKNRRYAELLSMDYCGPVSELSAITQYINNENRLFQQSCPVARTLLGIAMAEMIHLQKLGELIGLLGGNVDFVAKQPGGRQKMWTPAYLAIPEQSIEMIRADIESEKGAIRQYVMHIKEINDECVNAVLARIIKDEEYHIMLLQALADSL